MTPDVNVLIAASRSDLLGQPYGGGVGHGGLPLCNTLCYECVPVPVSDHVSADAASTRSYSA